MSRNQSPRILVLRVVVPVLVSCAVACGSVAGHPSAVADDAASDAADMSNDGGFWIGPQSDSSPCASNYGVSTLVCFASDAASYGHYLLPDAGIAVGVCPTADAFIAVGGESHCGYFRVRTASGIGAG